MDVDAVNKLKRKIICEFQKLLCLTEKGHKPDYQFILEEISLVGLSSDNLLDKRRLIFTIQFYLNNKWQIKTS
jgi:hypothetical protein|nr:MAG TPA: hypothetical protein [Caudoviricetes sp.]